MSVLATYSQWESDALGYRVGTLSMDLVPSTYGIKDENNGKFDVVFVSCDRWVEPANDAVAVDHLYDMELQIPGGHVAAPDVFLLSSTRRKHVAIAREAIRESRFLRDPRLCDRSPDRYVKWLTEHRAYALVDTPDNAFLVATDDPDGCRRISLLAVSEESRGSGSGTRLVSGVFAIEPARKIWRTKVSARNHRGLRFYECLGFRVKSVSTVFHVWMSK